MINEKLEHLLLRIYFIGITKTQTNGIIPVVVKNCSQPLDRRCDSACKTPRFHLADGNRTLHSGRLGAGRSHRRELFYEGDPESPSAKSFVNV